MATSLERAIVVGSSYKSLVCAPDSIRRGISRLEGQDFRFYRMPVATDGIPAGTLFLLSPHQDPNSGYGLQNMARAFAAVAAVV